MKESIVAVAEWQRKCLKGEDFSWKHLHFPLEKISIVAPEFMSGSLSHFCGKINFAAKPEFMAGSEIARNENSKGTTVLMIMGAKRSSTIATIHLPMLVVALNKEAFHKYIITERNLPDPTSFSAETSSWQRIRVFFNTAESIINKWKRTLLWWGLAMLALCFFWAKEMKISECKEKKKAQEKGAKPPFDLYT